MSAGGGEPVFEVHISKGTADRLRQIILHSPRAAEILASLRKIHDCPRRDPWNFGEQRYHLYDARLQVRVAVVSPIAIKYGVHMDRPVVYINGFEPLQGA